MTKLLFVGDLHYSGVNPENYVSDYKEDFRTQMQEVYDLARKHNVEAILTPGDVFNSHTVSNSTLLELFEILQESPVKWYTIIGNHDIVGYNTDSYNRSSLRLLNMLLSDKVRLISNDKIFPSVGMWHFAIPDKGEFVLTGTHYSNEMDVDGYGYTPETCKDVFNIHLSHGMLLDHVPPFERYTLIQDVQTTADLVLCGHDHTGFGVVTRSDGKMFCNPGAFMRQKASENELNRTVQVALITVGFENTVELIPLQSAKPGHEVLSRKALEEAKQRDYAMSEFAALIQSKTGEVISLDTLQVVQEIGKSENVPQEVISEAVRLIQGRRGKKTRKEFR